MSAEVPQYIILIQKHGQQIWYDATDDINEAVKIIKAALAEGYFARQLITRPDAPRENLGGKLPGYGLMPRTIDGDGAPTP